MEALYAVDKGIPWSEYLERWEGSDRSLVVAVRLEEAERCSSCGSADWEWAEDPDAYRAMTVVCMGCVVKDRERLNSDDGARIPGSSIRLVPRERAQAMSQTKGTRPQSRRERSKAE